MGNYVTGSKGTVPQVLVSNMDFEGRVIFPLSPAFGRSGHEDQVQTEFVLVTSNGKSWGEATINEVSTSLKRDQGDKEGPVGLHMESLLYEKGKVKTRINVIGSIEFIDDKYSNYADNSDYLIHLLNKPIAENVAQD